MPISGPNYVARGNIAPSRFVKQDTATDFGVLQAAAATDKIVGISQDGSREAPIPSVSTVWAGQSGDTIRIYLPGEQCLLELGGTVTAGDDLVSDANGKGVKITTGATAIEKGARALEGGVSGDLISVVVEPATEGGTATS